MPDSSAQSRVLFLFPDAGELRYMQEPPKLGQRVRSVDGDVWTVAEVMKSGIDTYTVSCTPRLGSVQDLAADLLEPARKSILRQINHGRTAPMLIDQNMSDLPWVKPPPNAPNASDAPIDSEETSGKHGGDGVDRRKHERHTPIADALASLQLSAFSLVTDLFGEEGIAYWLFGGWAVDFYAGSVTRAHDDVDIAVWLESVPRISTLLEGQGWRHVPLDDEDGGTGYERESVRLKLTYLVRHPDGAIFTPLRRGRGAWSMEALADDVGELRGVHSRLVGLAPLMRAKSSPRADPEEAAKDNADFEQLSRVESGTPIETIARSGVGRRTRA